MTRTLTPSSSLDNLRLEAKRWLKAIDSGDAAALARLRTAIPHSSAAPGLRDIQLALAREHGLPGWTDLKQALADLVLGRQSAQTHVDTVLRACWGGDPAAAARILGRWPQVGMGWFLMDVIRGDVVRVTRHLARNPGSADAKAGPLNWEPLLYLAYASQPVSANAVAMATLLLDHGARVDVFFDDGWGNPFTALAGVIGQGEGDRPSHVDAQALANLLIERGASPFDTQVLYNNSIRRDETDWLDFLWAASGRHGLLDKWRAPAGMGGRFPSTVLNYLLGNAVAYGHRQRAAWLLDHGADANAIHAYDGKPLMEVALMYGHGEIGALLARHGAVTPHLTGVAAFQTAVMSLDAATARELTMSHPACLRDPSPLLTAAHQGRVAVVSLLLDLGMPVDLADHTGQRALQYAVMGDHLPVVELLVAKGAEIDRPTQRYDGAMGFAAHFGRLEIAAFLAPFSRDVLNLTSLGMVTRLAELFQAEPDLANRPDPRHAVTPLFALPDDEDRAAAITELLLAYGADPSGTNAKGVTAEQAARDRGLFDAADLMRAAMERVSPAGNAGPRR